jgi:hypothetical protein
MKTNLTVAAAGLMWCVASVAFALPATDGILSNYSDWNDKATLPSVAVSSPAIEDTAVQLVSDDEAAAPAHDDGGCANCDACGACNMCECYCGPTCSVTAGAVFLHRQRPEGERLVVPTAGPGMISTGQDYSFGWDAGPDLTIERRMASGNIWQVRYFADDDATADPRNYGAVGNVRIGSFSNFGATALTSTYFTTLHSTELNWLHPMGDRCTFLAGFRWIELHDNLSYNIVFPAFNADYHFDENNHLYGAQMGTILNLWNLNSPFKLDAGLKAGIYGNVADNAFSLVPSTGGFFGGGGNDTDLAFVGEIDVTGSYFVTEHMALRGGYQVLWLDGVALASNQLANATAASSQAGIDTSDKLFYSGAIASVEFFW